MASESGVDEATRKRVMLELKNAAKLFRQPLPSCTDQLFGLLDRTENVLCKVWQGIPLSALRPLAPIMQKLVSTELLHHPDENIRIAIAGCLSEITRITAPDAPYEDPTMKEVFQLFMVVLQHLSGASPYNFAIAHGILHNLAKVRTCLLMMDIVSKKEMVEMFTFFLDTISPEHHSDVFTYMEMIMVAVIEETEEISFDLLWPLLDSVRMDNKELSPASWKLGKNVIEKCDNILREPLKEAVKSMNLDVEEYAKIVISLCRDTANGENMERDVSLIDESGERLMDAIGNLSNDENSLGTSNYAEQILELRSKNARSDVEVADGAEIVESESGAVDAQRKRGRKPKLMRPEEGYDHPCVSDPSLKDLDSTTENGHGKRGQPKKKERMENQQKEAEWSSEVRRKILQGKVNKSGSSAAKKTGKMVIAGTSFSDKEMEERILENATGEKDLSHQGPSWKKEKRGEIIPQKRELDEVANKTVGSVSTSKSSKTKSRKNSAHEKKPRGPPVEYGDALVNLRIQVWWPKDKTFYSGTVADYNPVTKRHTIKYDDEEIEILNLKRQRWELLDDLKPEESLFSSLPPCENVIQSSGQGSASPSLKDKTPENTSKRKKASSKGQHAVSSYQRPKSENHDEMKSGDNSSHEAIHEMDGQDYETYETDASQRHGRENHGS